MLKSFYLMAMLCGLIGSPLFAQSAPQDANTLVPLNDVPESRAPAVDKTLIDDTEGLLEAMEINPNRRWLGVICGPVEGVLRAQLDLPEDVGLVVQQVVPGSPAEQAGLRQHDILLAVDQKPLNSTKTLIQAIGDAGERELKLEWLRKGQQLAAVVTPAERPDVVSLRDAQAAVPGLGGATDELKRWVDQLGSGGGQGPTRLRFLGPGIVGNHAAMPGNLNIQITRQGDQPADIVVKRDGDTWTLKETDLDALPDDVRPHVESMLHGGGITVFGEGLPDIRALDLEGIPWPQMRERFDDIDRRMEKMFEELQRMQERPLVPQNAPEAKPPFDPNNDA